MQTSQCLPNLLKVKEKEKEKKEDDDDEDDEEMEGKKRGEEDMQDSLVVEENVMLKFFFVPSLSFLLPLQLQLYGSFNKKVVKRPLCSDTLRPNILNYLVPPEAPDHLSLPTLSFLPVQCNQCGKSFSSKCSLSKPMLVVHGASCLLKI